MDIIDRDKAASFNQQACVYDQVRPGYPPEMYQQIRAVCSITPHSHLLEVGAGTGIATIEMSQQWSAQIIGIEPGQHLYQLAQQKAEHHSNIRLVNQSFEEFAVDMAFQAIVSATAFHWIDPAVKYRKSAALLQPNGYLILFWNNFSRDDTAIFNDLQGLYEKHFPEHALTGKDTRAFQQEKIRTRTQEIEDSGYFRVIFHRVYRWYKRFDAPSFVGLLKTYSDHAVKNRDAVGLFYDDVYGLIADYGNEINLPIDVSLDIGQRLNQQNA